MDHLLHDNDSDFPLAQQLLSNSSYKRMYIAHLKTILLENFDNDSYYQTGLSLQSVIDASVKADGNKFFTYDGFLSNLTTDYSSGGGGGRPGMPSSEACGITNLMETRSSYLLGLSDFTATAPSISEIQLSTSSPIIGETITLTVDVTDATDVYLAYRYDKEDIFTKALMTGNATYTYEMNIEESSMQYYIYAENNDAGMFSPQHAQHEFFTLNASIEPPTLGDLVINEFMASNYETATDYDDEADDWIEIYNNSTEAIDLSGYFLSDDVEQVAQWAFPSGTVIEGNAYLIVWADKDEEQEGLHCNFKLSATAESVILSDKDTVTLDVVNYSNQITDISYARIPNGTGEFQACAPTFLTENSTTASIEDKTKIKTVLLIYPNPADDNLTITVNESAKETTATIYNTMGKAVTTLLFTKTCTLDISNWSPGIYII